MANPVTQNTDLLRRIRQAARRGAIPHAMILSGGGDLPEAARLTAAAALCQGPGEKPCLACAACRKVMADIHPDVRTVREAERRELTVDAIRQLRQDVYIRPNEAERKVYIFADCDQLNERDQNVLLKIVEEGPSYAVFLFCAASAASLLPTIRSRCVAWKLRGGEEAAPSQQSLALCDTFAHGRISPVAQLLVELENRRIKREQLQTLLQDAWRICARALLLSCGKPDAAPDGAALALARGLSRVQLRKLTDCLGYYAAECRYNVGAGHVLGALAARWEEILRK